MKIATWNVNSIRARRDRLFAWLERHSPEVVCLQETKVVDEDFPQKDLMEAGYFSAFSGQKSYNGVAILSRDKLDDVRFGFDDGGDESQKRVVSAVTGGGIRVVCVYVPNGKAPNTESYRYKLEWFKRLRLYLDRTGNDSEPIVLCGDFNVAPEDRDVHEPLLWENEILCTPKERAALSEVVEFGFADVFRKHHDEGGLFSWWDYRMLGFPKNRGLRIDHIYMTPPLAEKCVDATIDREERKGKLPSDHAPVIATLSS